jgi:hypothetical protein
MTKEEAIKIIDSLYPTDSQFEKTNEVGVNLLAHAKVEIGAPSLTWRNEPTRILVRYAELCQEYEERSAREFMRQHSRA